MKKLTIATLAAVVASFAMSTFAGVAPNTGSSAAQQSGAKIAAPAKPATEEKKEHQEDAKEQAK
jgi:hypothetical protein